MMTIATYKWTIDRYHQAIASGVFDSQNIELLRGELIQMPLEREAHVYFSDRAAKLLQRLLAGRAQSREGRPVTLPNGSEPQPDIAIVQPLDTFYLEHHPYPENIFLAIEYSYTTLSYDLGDKQIAYAESGIPEYWVVDLQNLEIVIFCDPAPSGYRSMTKLADGQISSLAFPDIAIDLYSALRPYLRTRGCRVNVADVKVRVNSPNVYFYPDLVVSCDPQDLMAREAIESPMVIVEVLSPSTAAKDRSEKFTRYRSIPSLQEYILIETERIGVECYRRGEGRMWLYYPYIAGDIIELESIEFSCPVELLYEGVTFENLG